MVLPIRRQDLRWRDKDTNPLIHQLHASFAHNAPCFEGSNEKFEQTRCYHLQPGHHRGKLVFKNITYYNWRHGFNVAQTMFTLLMVCV